MTKSKEETRAHCARVSFSVFYRRNPPSAYPVRLSVGCSTILRKFCSVTGMFGGGVNRLIRCFGCTRPTSRQQSPKSFCGAPCGAANRLIRYFGCTRPTFRQKLILRRGVGLPSRLLGNFILHSVGALPSLPCVRGGAARSAAEGLFPTKTIFFLFCSANSKPLQSLRRCRASSLCTREPFVCANIAGDLLS